MAQNSGGWEYQSNPPSPGDESQISNFPETPNKIRGRRWEADDQIKSKKMKVEAESSPKTEKTLDHLLAAVRIDDSLTKKDIEKLANDLLEIGKLREDQMELENDTKPILDVQHFQNSESDKLSKRIEALKEIQVQHRALEILFLNERAELIKEYEDIRMLLLEKNGWNAVLVYKIKTVQGLAEEITENDEEALKYLLDINCTSSKSNDFKLQFEFASNPYFKDSVLTKTFHKTGDNMLKETIGMEIEWHPGKSLIAENGQSFFNFFQVQPVADTIEEVQRQMERNYNIGLTIREKITSALQFLHPVSVKVDMYHQLKRRFLMQRDELEEKFLKSCRSPYKKRCDIVNGTIEVGANGEAATNQKRNYKASQDNRGVPDFWLNAMKNNPILAQQITKCDEEALKYLTDIKWKKESGFGFELNFIFRRNPYFKNSVLTKKYQKPIYLNTSASKIKWHEDKCLTHDFIKKSGRKPMIRTRNSFFHFFNPLPPHPTKEEIYNHGQYIVETFKGNIKYDYHIGKIIRDKIIPHAISWYTGEALQMGSEFCDEEYDDGFSENEDEEDEDEEDEEDEDEEDADEEDEEDYEEEEDEDEEIQAGESH